MTSVNAPALLQLLVASPLRNDVIDQIVEAPMAGPRSTAEEALLMFKGTPPPSLGRDDPS